MKLQYTIFFCILLSLFTNFTARSQTNAEQVLNIGRNVLSMEDYMLSIHYFNLAAQAKPYLAEPYYYRALAKLMLDDYRGAEADASMALSRNKFLTEAYRVRGFALQKLNQDSLALLDFDKGLQYKPIDKYFLYYKVISQSILKQYSKALQSINTLLYHYPGFESARAERARIHLLNNDTIAALADIDTTLQKDKTDPLPYLLRADIEVKRLQWSSAATDLDTAINILPTQTDLYLNRAYVRYNNDDYFGAMSDYNYLLELQPDNLAALYNRALLLYEVRDLRHSVRDFNKVLELQPQNFHALYARALINFDLKKWSDAIADLHRITTRYPKFHQAYYALAHAYSQNGNMTKAIENYNKAENLVRLYVANPQKYPLDKPTIQQGVANDRSTPHPDDETDTQVMQRFNQLLTANSTETPANTTYQDAIKGRVQDRNMRIEPIPMFVLTPFDSRTELRPAANYLRELADYNDAPYTYQKLYIGPVVQNIGDNQDIETTVQTLQQLTGLINKALKKGTTPLPAHYFGRAIAFSLLKNYDAAIADFDSTLTLLPDLSLAYLGRSAAFTLRSASHREMRVENATTSSNPATSITTKDPVADLQTALTDLNAAIRLNPRLTYAWYNKGIIYHTTADYTSALECYNRALEIRPDFAEALYNRALTYLSLGNKNAGRQDLSRAGELGILPSYSLLKRMQ